MICLTAFAVGLLVGLGYSLAQRDALGARTIALFGPVVVLFGQGTTSYFYPFGVGVLLGLAYNALEEEWYGSAVAPDARCSYSARLFLKNITTRRF